MTQTTYSTIEVEGRHWLAPGKLKQKPTGYLHLKGRMVAVSDEILKESMEVYEQWLSEKSGWIEIKEEHAGEFKRRTGLEKGVHFEVVHEYLIHERWVTVAYFKNLIEQERTVAIPIKTEHSPNTYLTNLEGLTEGVDYQLIREILTPEGWIKAVDREWWENADEDYRRMVAVPIGEKEVQAKNRAAEYGDLDKDLVIYALEEASEQWKAEYDNCRAILQELVDLKIMKDEKGDSMEYRFRKPLAWIAAKNFLKKYQHQ